VDAELVGRRRRLGVAGGLVRDVILPGAVPIPRRPAVLATGAWLIMIIAEQINAKSGIAT